MIRLFHVYFPSRTLLLAVSEAFLIAIALLAATLAWVRGETELALDYQHSLMKIMVASVVCMLCMYYYDLYDSFVLYSPRDVLPRLVQVLGTACLILTLLFYAFPSVQLDAGPLLTWIVLAGVFLGVWRKLFFVLNRATGFSQRAVLLGDGPLATELSGEIEARPELGLRLMGYVGESSNGPRLNGLRCLGRVTELPALIEDEGISQIVLTMGDRRGKLPVEELLQLKARGVRIQDAADVYERITGRVPLNSLRPSWLLLSDGFHVSRTMRLYKRLTSLVLSLLGLVIALPAMALIAIAIRMDSRGPVLFRQKRYGKYGKVFTLCKFRSMLDGADQHGDSKPAEEEDARFTRVGQWLRRTRMDELPQLYNILIGDMSFIGPRPFAVRQEEELSQKIPFYSQRWSVSPGATGWAQVQRGYCVSLEDNIEKLSYDLFYIKNMSVGLDFLIVFQTIKILLLGRGAR